MKAYIVIEVDLEDGGSRSLIEDTWITSLKKYLEEEGLDTLVSNIWVRDDFDLLTMGG